MRWPQKWQAHLDRVGVEALKERPHGHAHPTSTHPARTERLLRAAA